MTAFEQYLETYHVEPLRVSFAAKVRYLAVWNALKGHPISVAQAQKIRVGVQKLTGVPYEGSLVTRAGRGVDELSTRPLKGIKRGKACKTSRVSFYPYRKRL